MYYIFGESADNFLGHYLSKAMDLEISAELRGWSDSGEMKPPSDDINLPIYIVASRYCPTARDVYLQYILKKKIEVTYPLIVGRLYHSVMAEVVPLAKKYIYHNGIGSDFNLLNYMISSAEPTINNIIEKNIQDVKRLVPDIDRVKSYMLNLWNFQSIQIVASVDLVLSKFQYIDSDALVAKAIPLTVEQRIDGSRIGLSKNLSVDAMQIPQTVVMDVKTGKPHDFHALTVAGYALAYESEFKKPINLGCIVYPRFIKNKSVPYIEKKPFLLNDALRKKFIKERNEKTGIIIAESDPGVADEVIDKGSCPLSCGFFNFCHPD